MMNRPTLSLAAFAALCLPGLALAQAPSAAPPQCPMVLDFDFDAAGNAILAGQDISSAYSAWGVDTIVWTAMSMNPSTDLGDPIAFDSANPTGGDWDLGTPNQQYGGPGVGVGGASNMLPLGNILISAENDIDANNDGLIDDPDDDAGGAWFVFQFDSPTCIFSATVIDQDANETPADLIAYDAAGNQLEWIDFSSSGNNGVETLDFSICGVDHVMVDIYSSGAVDNLVLCNGGTPEVCDGVDNDGDGEIDEDGYSVESALADPAVYGGSGDHSLWLPGIGDFVFSPNGVFEEDPSAGTATLTGTAVHATDPNKSFDVNVALSGRTSTASGGSPKLELMGSAYAANGGPVDPSTWYYYSSYTATLTGQDDLDGAVLELNQTGPNWQVGEGASGKNANFGASSWFTVNFVSQPNSGPALSLSGSHGDFNLDFNAVCINVDVCDGLDNDGDGVIDEDGAGATGAALDPSVFNYTSGSLTRALWLPGIGDFQFSPSAIFNEDPTDGTATLTGTLVDENDAGRGFELDCEAAGYTTVAQTNSPFSNLDPSAYVANGGPVDTSTWEYYEDFGCTLEGTGSLAGAELELVEYYANFQVGVGGNDRNTDYGAAAWVTVNIVSQPTSGPALVQPTIAGDLNLDLGLCFAVEVCNGVDDDGDGLIDEGYDADGDGVTSCGGDCDDMDADNYPGNPEVCDGADNDCDGVIDEGLDNDGDGVSSCDGDCDDNDANNYPGNTEVCDGADNDCDGVVPSDETDDDGDGVTECDGDCDDSDADNYPGNPEVCDGADNDCDGVIPVVETDDDGDGVTECDGDCDDSNPENYPGNSEICDGLDNDCDGDVDEGLDGDGDGWTECGGDCDDTDASVNPGATEVCDGDDEDCDGLIDEGYDADGDGVTTCGGDCDDSDNTTFPGAPEVCDGDDEDCDGLIDEGFDADGDGVTTCGGDCDDSDAGNYPGNTEVCDGDDEDCDGQIDEGFDGDGDGYTVCNGDCDDTDAGVNPGATEVCDGDDEDCDGQIDEGFDGDGDGYTTCGGDCDDTDASNNPGGTEVCDGDDEDCDGLIDEGFDGDGDGYTVCGGDCDDTNFDVNPGANEVCNGLDDDCDGVLSPTEVDADGDGWAECDGDCDDTDATTNPGATELCDNVDNDCDGIVDEGYDLDGDGYSTCDGDCDDTDDTINPDAEDVCDNIDNDCDGVVDNVTDDDGDGYSVCDGDCDDTDPAVNPGATELCNGIDDDCDGVLLSDEADNDGDGVPLCDDCDDSDFETYPGAPELCDGLDNDCDGVVPNNEFDWDGDGQPECDGDCDDGDPTIYTGAPELCDNIDTDCDGAADNGYDADGDGIPDCVDQCPQLIDNDLDPWGEAIPTGTDVTDVYASWGITIERFEDGALSVALPSVTWDSGNPAAGEEDLATPNVDFGGPGLGVDGGVGGAGPNDVALENVQNGTAGNTWWVVSFSSSTCVHEIKFVDVDQGELPAQVILFDVNVQTINTFTASGLGNNSVETLDLGGTCGVYVMMIDGYASVAWDDLLVCVDPDGGPEVCGDGIDNDGDGDADEDCLDAGPDLPAPGVDNVDYAAGPDTEDGAGCSQGGSDIDPKLGFLLLVGMAMGIRRRKPYTV